MYRYTDTEPQAPTIMKKDSDTQFIVAVLAPEIVEGDIDAKLTCIKDGDKPLLLISGQSGQREMESGFRHGYNYFQQYILLPVDVKLDTFTPKLQNGLFICSFQRMIEMRFGHSLQGVLIAGEGALARPRLRRSRPRRALAPYWLALAAH